MYELVKKKSQKSFECIAFHNFLYGDVTTWDYFSTAPVKYILFRLLNFIQVTCAKIIISRKGNNIFLAYSIGIVDKYTKWNPGPNMIATKIDDLKMFWIETCIWVKISKKVLFRSFL